MAPETTEAGRTGPLWAKRRRMAVIVARPAWARKHHAFRQYALRPESWVSICGQSHEDRHESRSQFTEVPTCKTCLRWWERR